MAARLQISQGFKESIMKQTYYLYALLFICLHTTAQNNPRTIAGFDDNWKFLLGDDSAAVKENYNDSHWRTLNLPHDWSIEGDFSPNHPATTQGGALPTGIGWYRKTFSLPASANNKHISIEFDGIYRNSEVWINGHYLGKRPNGYISFQYDCSHYIKPAPQKNVLVVKVDNSQQPNSRWYTGSGIYRHVRLVIKNKTAVAHWGTFITTPQVSTGKATVKIAIAINNESNNNEPVTVYTELFDASGKKVAIAKTGRPAVQNSIEYTAVISKPNLWSVDNPYLYKAVTKIDRGGKVIDEVISQFGIRYFHFDKDKGFFLNGKPLKIAGVCNHHDLGALGAAVNNRAIERQLEILKAMGCNAIRTAHNPPAPELLDLCDKMGFLVMVEAFDMWKKKKTKYDYYSDFEAWHQKDMEAMVKRDRNHPSVFMWSIGNEIREQFDSSGITIAKELVNIIKSLDTTRPVTAGLSEWNPQKNFIYQSGALDIVGLNYHHEVYTDFHKYYPGQVFVGAENMSAFATRGHYGFPSDSSYFWPARSPQKIVENGNPDYTVSAYDQVSAYWGSTHETTWKIIKQHDFMSGLFVWSGFDFLGEPIPYPWPARSSYYGIIDLAGFPKDVYYLYQSEWTSKPVLHVFPHWNWTPGKPVDIWAYYNMADEVELFVNGRSQGVQKKDKNNLHVFWRVPFEPGTLKAVSRKNGKTVLVKEIKTAGEPAIIELTADRKKLQANGKDLSFVTVRILDSRGNFVPYADNEITFSVTGNGFLAGTDNGYQADTVSLKSKARHCWKGMALAMVQAGRKKGNITLQATGTGLRPAILTLKTNH